MKLTVAILVLVTVSSFAVAENLEIRFGKIQIIERVGERGLRFGFVEEMLSVPILTVAEGGLYGLEYRAPEDATYTIQVSAIVPPGVVETGGDLVSVQRSEDETVMLFEKREMSGSHVEPFLFDKSDPAGKYTLVVYLNDRPYKTISYVAYHPAAH